VLESGDPLGELQRARWEIHPAHIEYQSAAEQRRQLAADIGELIRELVDVLGSMGWSEERARNVDVAKLARGAIELRR
jgi:hypothetical protein